MARKILGYIQLVWTCDSCGTKNPGAIKTCTSCGAPQPEDVHFEKVDPETFDFIKDEALIRMAQSGPDKHCPYCGTRNLGDAERCTNCGSDLTVGAKVRESGAILEESAKPAAPAPAKPMPKSTLLIIILAVLAICILGGIFLSQMSKTDQVNATVSAIGWQRSIVLEGYQLVRQSGWDDAVPSDAENIRCAQQFRYESPSFVANSTEICGEPYTIDTGTGLGEVVQDCVYRVYDDYCEYETWAWTAIDTLVTSGTDLDPYWPSANLASSQRFGAQQETYKITFNIDGQNVALTTSDLNLFQMAQPGSTWQLEVNQFGNIVNAEPVD